MKRQIQYCVIGSSTANDDELKIAFDVGKLIGELDGILISGGMGGIMEWACRGARENNGITVAITPSDDINIGNNYNTIRIPTGMGFTRNSINILSSDVVISIGGGAGTLSELAFAWMYKKQIFAYGLGDGWSKKIPKRVDDRRSDPIVKFNTTDELKMDLSSFRDAFKFPNSKQP